MQGENKLRQIRELTLKYKKGGKFNSPPFGFH
jgi:hypothetical protein